jgi:hypothetical protein
MIGNPLAPPKGGNPSIMDGRISMV